jgi:hypothetical protein
LAASKIDPGVARARGYTSVDAQADLQRHGFSQSQRRAPGLLIPVHDVHGQIRLHQYRPDNPRVNGDGKSRKYETPTGARMCIDVPPPVRGQLVDPSVPLYITEGARKADAAVTAGLCCVALLGVWNWKGSNELGGKAALSCWDGIALNGRDVYIAYDSDAATKDAVQRAMQRLARFLGDRGAVVRIVYLPSDGGEKVGLDDWLAAGGDPAALPDLAYDAGDAGGSGCPSATAATVQRSLSPEPAEPPNLAHTPEILDEFASAVRAQGVIGEHAHAQLLYLVLTSRLLRSQVSAGVKGHSASGKSNMVDSVTKFFPDDALVTMTAMSEKALVFDDADYRHRTLILYEASALRENADDDMTSYFVRSLLSEGRLEYKITERSNDGGFTTRTIVKDGPTNLIFTTTKTAVHAENETRVLSLSTDDSATQTGRVLESDDGIDDGHDGGGDGADLAEWRRLQTWLAEHGERRVVVPYWRAVTSLVRPVAVRLRRDIPTVRSLVCAHALLHQQTRARDERGRVVATLDDYAVVRDLVSDLIDQAVGQTVAGHVREVVDAVAALADDDGATVAQVARHLELDKSVASRRLRQAADGGHVANRETRHGRSGRWVVDEPLPDAHSVLPPVDRLQPVATPPATAQHDETAAQSADSEDRCTVARAVEGHPPGEAGGDAAGTTPPTADDDGGGHGRCVACGRLAPVRHDRGYPLHSTCPDPDTDG